MKDTPPDRYNVPKVNLSSPLIASSPMVAMNSPIRQLISPFKIEPDDTEVIMLMPNTAKAKYSGLLNCSASFASIGANKIRHIVEKTPPKVDAIVEIDSARPG